MPIVAKCACGKRIGVADALAGRTVRCPACGEGVLVTPAAAASPGGGGPRSPAAVAQARRAANASPAVTVSPGIIIAAVVGVALVAIVCVLYFGPWRTGQQWAAMAPQANTTVTDVVMFALQAHQSSAVLDGADRGPGGVSVGKAPAIEGPAVFVPPMGAFSLPRRIVVSGRTSQGGYIGTYDTVNGEVAVTLEVGGYTVGGMADLHKPTGKIQVVGREQNGVVTAESDGQPMTITVPKWHGRHGEIE